MSEVFVSYASADRDRVKPLVGEIQEISQSVFWDDNIRAGTRWRERLEDELSDSKVAIPIWSQYPISSDWVKFEAAFSSARCGLFPVLIDGVEIPKPFDEIHAFRLFGWPDTKPVSELNSFLAEVREAIGGDPFATSPGSRMASLKKIQKRIDGIGTLLPAGSDALASARLWKTMRESIAKASSSLNVDHSAISNRAALIKCLAKIQAQLPSTYDTVIIIDPRKRKIVQNVMREIEDICEEIANFRNTHLKK